jgi:hypothetical protein
VSDFVDVFGEWLNQIVVVRPYVGAGMEGAELAAAITIGGENSDVEGASVMIESKRRLIRASDGNEIVSETTLYVTHPGAESFPLHSEVDLPDGSTTTVEATNAMTVYGLFDHLVVNLA